MAQHKVVVCCWSHGHETELSMTRLQEEKLAKQIPKLKAVCPTCRESDNGNQAIFIKHGDTVFGSHKTFVCRHGHTSLVSPFSSGMLHIRFGPGEDDFTNIKGTIEELEELIDNKDITCYHTKVNNQACGCKLKAVDSSSHVLGIFGIVLEPSLCVMVLTMRTATGAPPEPKRQTSNALKTCVRATE